MYRCIGDSYSYGTKISEMLTGKLHGLPKSEVSKKVRERKDRNLNLFSNMLKTNANIRTRQESVNVISEKNRVLK